MNWKFLILIISVSCQPARSDQFPPGVPVDQLESEFYNHVLAGSQYLQSRQFRAAEVEYAAAIAIARRLPAGDLRLAAALNNHSAALKEQGRIEESRPMLVEALKLWRA